MTKQENPKRYRIKKIRYVNKTEFWIEKSIQLLGIHLYWDKTTLSYYRTEQSAIEDLVSILGLKIETISKLQ